ncbi:type I polyketide synthase [Brasilonema bromeliae]|uniref:Polyketide synthase n=1 Tax=Brasilonema bromeliae SPC951 TaxID=385972 RepID=A0ABX1PCQ8_9CYAN|nr:type I polyketide synthase [Brasilonema bromeliae]NMG22259.1 hypothetical protein [Brasilonema bromeliae SPC951]
MASATNLDSLEGIAIIGMAGRFPGAKNIEQFWHNLRSGIESISVFTDEELISSGIDPAVVSDPNYIKVSAVLEDTDLFDASFFGFNHREAEITDPQHRLFLECAWEALENAGYDSTRCESRIGVYAGASLNNYLSFNLNHDQIGSAITFQKLIGSDKDFLTTRVSYKLNLTGPSFTVQTACSTSLVATTLACQSLVNYQCDMALVGGVSIRVPQKTGYLYQEGGILSPDGHCHAFDAMARGTIVGNGVGVVVLKRLADALADRDSIHAVIKGSAINNDGSLKVGYTAPSVDGQAEAIAEAQALAGIEPETVSYIEAHGTGTSLGDPIEIAALTKVFRASTQKKGFCAIGSVKTNVGHLDAAAGITSLIKTVLALKHKQIPPSLHFEKPNPQIDFANSPFYVNTKLSEWKTNGTPRRAGVSSFGIGGTNAHVILEEAPVVELSDPIVLKSRPWQVLMLSAKTSSALETATANLANYLQQHPDLNLADVAYTLQIGRQGFEHRRTVVCRSIEDALDALVDPKRVLTGIQETQERPVAFMFPGQGAQYVDMGKELYQSEPIFRDQVDLCCQLLQPHLGLDLRSLIYPNESESKVAAEKLQQTDITQPALFVIEYALAQLWMSWGISPGAMIGHSIGEYVAACLAGVMSVADALALVAARGRLMQQLPSGAMLSVPLPEEEVRALLDEKLSLAACNAPALCVVSGTHDAIDAFQNKLQGIECRRLLTSHAFHSSMMERILERFQKEVSKVKLHPPKISFISNVTGTWITASQATDPNYWATHLRSCVHFSQGISVLLQEPNRILLEVGSGRTLCTFALKHSDAVGLSSLPHPKEKDSDVAFLMNTLGKVWLSGVQIDWSRFYAHQRRYRIPLPTYPFERQRYWIESQKNTRDVNLSQTALEQKLDIKDWFYIPSWKRSVPPISFETRRLTVEKQCWLVFVDTCGIGTQILEKLKRENQNVITVKVGEQFCHSGECEYTINPQNKNDYDALLKAIRNLGQIPTIIAHLWNITPSEYISSRLESCEKAQDIGFWSLVFLAQALGEQNISDSIQIDVVSNNMQQLLDEDELCPEKATILGPCKVISQEYSNITCRSIDIKLPQSGTRQWEQLINHLLTELAASTSEQVIAYRGNQRWVQCFEALPIESQTSTTARLREEGVYIITGGLGEIGLIFAEHLAKTVQAKIVLIGRSGLPPKAEWEQWSSSHDDQDLLSTKIKKVQILEELGAEVLVLTADVANLEQMQALVNQVRDRFGEIHGVIHAAGVPGAGLIQLKTTELATNVLEPKVKGTLVLDAVLQDINLDFLVLFSSITATAGGFGQVDYCAANAFLDAFAHYNFYQQQIPTVSINWDWWQGNNWADSLMSAVPEFQAEFKQMRERYGISFVEGVDAFSRILSTKLPQVVVSTQNLQTVIDKFKSFAAPISSEKLETSEQSKPKHPRPILGIAYVPPSSDLEQKIADIWQELLGIEQVGINDNFFDLGGHSLLATQLVSQLRKDFQVELSLRHIFEAPTIAELALMIEDLILRELEELTEDEANVYAVRE